MGGSAARQAGLGVTILDRHGTVMYSDIATVAPDVIGADSERGGVSGEAIGAPACSSAPQERISRW